MENSRLYIGLLHGPILNKRGAEVTTSVTNLDIHDIARSSRTFGFKKYFIITPFKAQHELLARILGHWEEDKAALYNPDRQDALMGVSATNNLDETLEKIAEIEGVFPYLAVTGASFKGDLMDAKELIHKIQIDNRPLLLLFGTGWGLPNSIVERADFRLTPIEGFTNDGYNHLSVRSAVAIYCDRLTEHLKK